MEAQLEFDLNEAIKDPSKAKEIVKGVQKAFTEMSNASLEAIESAKAMKNVAVEYEKQLKLISNANLDLTTAMKNIHIILSNRTDMFKDDPEMQEVIAGLATFVTGAGAIKLGVINKAKEDNNESNN